MERKHNGEQKGREASPQPSPKGEGATNAKEKAYK